MFCHVNGNLLWKKIKDLPQEKRNGKYKMDEITKVLEKLYNKVCYSDIQTQNKETVDLQRFRKFRKMIKENIEKYE